MKHRWATTWIAVVLISATVTLGMPQLASAAGRALAGRVDRDGDGRADLVVLRPTGEYQQWQWYWQRSSMGFETKPFGGSRMVPVIGDWDGDRRTDLAGWDPSGDGQGHGQFQIWRSTPSPFLLQIWGEPGDDPTVVADYSGDGRTDTAVYRPGAPSTWFIATGHTPHIVVQWGEASDVPTPGDYDGDGRADIAVARPSGDGTFHWFIRLSGGGVRLVQFGNVDDFIVPGDFDGDGRADLAVTRDTGGILTWFIYGSSTGFRSVQFGNTATDYEVAEDYDGDGETDIAVWREQSPGKFFIFQSSNGSVRVESWGEPGDFPLANLPVRAAP